jgi:hypothetical protein
MAKHKNQRIWSADRAFLQNLADEQEKYIGRRYHLDLKQGLLIIFALPQYHKKNPKPKVDRDKRSEKFERRER